MENFPGSEGRGKVFLSRDTKTIRVSICLLVLNRLILHKISKQKDNPNLAPPSHKLQ